MAMRRRSSVLALAMSLAASAVFAGARMKNVTAQEARRGTFAQRGKPMKIFHKDFNYSSGLVKLGQIDSGVEILTRPGPLESDDQSDRR
jgi:hypothetical protein